MNLDSTTKLLQIVLGEAKTTSDCDIVASYADSTATGFTLGNQNEKSNGTTPVTVVAAPAVDTQRQVKEIRLFNNDTVIHTVTLQLYDGTNTWIIGPSALSVSPGAAFVYTPESGVCCPSGSGTVTQVVAGTNLNVGAGPGGTITTAGTLNLANVPALGGVIGNAATITVKGLAGTGTGNGGLAIVQGGTSGAGATGNGGDLQLLGGVAASTNGDGGTIQITGANATGSGTGGSIGLTAGSSPSGTQGIIDIASQVLWTSGTPSVPAVNSDTITGSDQVGIISIGAGVTTSVVVTFGGNYSFAPKGVVISPANAAAAASGVGAYVDTLSSTGWTLHGTALANCEFYYHAF